MPQYKLILSGSVAELIVFKKPSFGGWSEGRQSSIDRARKRLRRLINANAGQWWNDVESRFYQPLFLTLTFRENIEDVKYANRLFTDFVKRFNYHFFGSKRAELKYSVVIEFQQRGAVHYHVVLYNVPFIKDLPSRIADVWTHGFVQLKAIDQIKHVGSYVVKYMTKDMSDPRLQGKKLYFSSRGLIKPLEIVDDFKIADIVSVLPEGSEVAVMENDEVSYTQYRIDQSPLRYLTSTRKAQELSPEIACNYFQGVLEFGQGEKE